MSSKLTELFLYIKFLFQKKELQVFHCGILQLIHLSGAPQHIHIQASGCYKIRRSGQNPLRITLYGINRSETHEIHFQEDSLINPFVQHPQIPKINIPPRPLQANIQLWPSGKCQAQLNVPFQKLHTSLILNFNKSWREITTPPPDLRG
jgi:hypothetical protein